MELHKVLDNINGQMETTIAVISLMGRSRVRGCGGSQLLIFQQISLKVPFLMIWNMDMVSLLGVLEINIKEVTLMTINVATVKWNGLMEVNIKVFGIMACKTDLV